MLLFGQARPGVFNFHQRHLAGVAQTKRDLPLGCELDGITQQVEQNLAHAFFVAAHHGRQYAAFFVVESQSLGLRFELE
ncbi:hypothetical protein GALL_464570 [mine drainage metagenome]|uniref:Uncharacterized protein n=1 Tax=mine drainage metagenome TaxID=410659 RepID=A0A1J5PK52_9ZZZZ